MWQTTDAGGNALGRSGRGSELRDVDGGVAGAVGAVLGGAHRGPLGGGGLTISGGGEVDLDGVAAAAVVAAVQGDVSGRAELAVGGIGVLDHLEGEPED